MPTISQTGRFGITQAGEAFTYVPRPRIPGIVYWGLRQRYVQLNSHLEFRNRIQRNGMKGNMPNNQPMQEQATQAPPELSPEAAQAVDRFIRETDWNAFWSRVVERTTPEVEAYEKARVKSLETAPQHVFM